MSTNFPNGLYSRGTPVEGIGYGWHKDSTIRFVDGTNGNDNNDGSKPDEAYATIKAAIDDCTAYDVVYVMPKIWLSGTDPSGRWLGSPYTEDPVTIAYANESIAVVGVAHQALHGPPYSTVWEDNSTSAQVTIQSPMCAFENLAFERASGTSGQIYASGNVQGTDEGCLTTIYNCHFHYGRGSTTDGSTGGAVYGDGMWGMTVDNCSFLGCLNGVAIKSNTATSGNITITNNVFRSRLTSASDISSDIYIYTQGSTNLFIANNYFAHLIPSGGHNRFISVQADIRQGLITGNHLGSVQGTTLTVGSAGTGIVCPDNVGHGANYCNGTEMSEAT
jgi:hypothetical protein